MLTFCNGLSATGVESVVGFVSVEVDVLGVEVEVVWPVEEVTRLY